MALETKFHTLGFLKDATYTFYIPQILDEFEDSFLNAETLTLNLVEVFAGSKHREKAIIFSEDGKSIEINITESKFKDKKGNYTEAPTPNSVFKHVRFILNKAVKEYAEKFSNSDK